MNKQAPPRERPRLRVATQIETRAKWLVVLAGVGSVAVLALLIPTNLPEVVAAPVCGCAFLASLAVLAAARKRSHAVLEQHNFHLCEFCAYPLGGLGDSGSCPECGAAFSLESAQAYWKAVYQPEEQKWMRGEW
jgi:hypothetical protein